MHPLTEIIANNPDLCPRRIYIVSYGSVVARNVFTIDWGMPALAGKRLRIVDDPYKLRGVWPEREHPWGDVLWFSPSADRLSQYYLEEIRHHAHNAQFRIMQWYEHPFYHCPDHPNFVLRRDARISRSF